MDIEYSNDLRKKLKDEKTIKKNYPAMKDRIEFTLSVLASADHLSDVPNVPPTRRHKLSSSGMVWALDLSRNYRLLLEALDGDVPQNISRIKLLEIEDYH